MNEEQLADILAEFADGFQALANACGDLADMVRTEGESDDEEA